MTGLQTSAESPVPVRTVARLIGQWVSRLGRVWVEGQVTEVSRRPGAATVFLTLRDPVADVSLRLTCSRGVCDAVAPPLADGARVVVHAKPEFYLARGTLTLAATEIRPLGVGALLARLEQLKSVLHAEGLFDPARKRPLPFLPRVVGLVCGRASAAERDVLEVARARWPAVRFDVREVAVQGHLAVEQVGSALRALEAEPEVDVVVVARGGGSVEDLLPFSDEALVRLVAALRTPVVSAIGHEPDVPLLDLVADVRASTPTDAARRVVPDVTEELSRVGALSERLRRAVRHRLDVEQRALDGLRGRPALADPLREVERREAEVTQLRDRAGRAALGALHRAEDDLAHSLARVRALSPQATLDRGYAVVQHSAGPVVVEPADVVPGELLRVRVAGGRFTARAAAGSGTSGGPASSVRT